MNEQVKRVVADEAEDVLKAERHAAFEKAARVAVRMGEPQVAEAIRALKDG